MEEIEEIIRQLRKANDRIETELGDFTGDKGEAISGAIEHLIEARINLEDVNVSVELNCSVEEAHKKLK